MDKIKNIVFDFGGVVLTIDHGEAVRRFKALGLKDTEKRLNPYTQGGIFGDLELGLLSAEEFTERLGELCGRRLTFDDSFYAWMGYRKELPEKKLQKLLRLREEGYKVILLSNTNPFMWHWADSPEFDGKGHPVGYYFDSVYVSYKLGVMKPDPTYFWHMLMHEQALPFETLFIDDGPRNVAAASQLGINTYCPQNGEDWTEKIDQYLHSEFY